MTMSYLRIQERGAPEFSGWDARSFNTIQRVGRGDGNKSGLTSMRGCCLPNTVVIHHRHLGWPVPWHSTESFVARLKFYKVAFCSLNVGLLVVTFFTIWKHRAPACRVCEKLPGGCPALQLQRTDTVPTAQFPSVEGLSPACGPCCPLTGFPCRLFRGYPTWMLTDPSPNVKPFPSGPHPMTNQDGSIKAWPLEPNSKEL